MEERECRREGWVGREHDSDQCCFAGYRGHERTTVDGDFVDFAELVLCVGIDVPVQGCELNF